MLLAVLLRLAAWQSIEGTWDATHPRVDAYTYWQQTLQLLAGEQPFSGGYYQPPGYPWLMAWEQGLADTPDPRISRAFNLLFGVLSTLGLGRLGRVVSGWKWGGAVAMGLFVLAGAPLRYELDLLTPAASLLAMVVGLNLLLPTDRHPLWVLGAGLVSGAAALLHPTTLLAWVFIGAVLLVRQRLHGVLLLVGLALPIAPIAWENRTQHESGALISENGGLNLYLFNNPQWKETAFLRPGLPFRQLVLDAEPHRRDLQARNAYWRARTRDEWSLSWALPALVEKAWWSIHARPIPRNEDWRCRTEGSLAWLAWMPNRVAWLVPFALLGCVAQARSRRWLLPAALLGGWLPLLLFLPAERYRVVLWPVLVLLTVTSLGELRDAVRARQVPRWWAAGVGLWVAALWPIDHITAKQPGWCAHREGNLAIEQRQYEEAEAHYLEAARAEPDNAGHWFWLAQARLRQKDSRGAIEALERSAALFPAYFETRKQLQKEYGRQGEYLLAAEHAGAGCALPDAPAIICARHVELLWKAGERQRARAFVAEHPELRAEERVQRLGL